MSIATNLGYPRIGPGRELKRALELFWEGKIAEPELLARCAAIRRANWELQRDVGIQHIPSNDFSLYDHVLDTVAMVGAVPERYGWKGSNVDLRTYFAMARGIQDKPAAGNGADVPAMEMTKWFDTNYHYIVPELRPNHEFKLSDTKAIDEFLEAKALGIQSRPVLLGPVSFVHLAKGAAETLDRPALVERLTPVYAEVLQRLRKAGADWVQIDEPALVLDLDDRTRAAYLRAYAALREVPDLKILLATYFGELRDNLKTAVSLPVDALHVDLVRGPGQLGDVLANAAPHMLLSLGVVDGRNVWKTDLEKALQLVEQAAGRLGANRVMVGPACSMLYAPVDLDLEHELDAELRQWLAFARQKLDELAIINRAINHGRNSVAAELAAYKAAIASRSSSPRIHSDSVKRRAASVTAAMLRRAKDYGARRPIQREVLALPEFPTTTLGSFPQTKEVRSARAAYKAGKKSRAEYEAFLRAETERAIRIQEEIGLDVLVHGEFERTDMVEYFGEQLQGVAITSNGWVQSYGSRCARPPIIYGDIIRPAPMTLEWIAYAQSLTKKPVKGVMTGPVTIMQWSFVRDDQPRSETCRQLALAIRDEVADLEGAGVRIIQVDEPALREGLPLRRAGWAEYLEWAVECFRLATSGVRDSTQVHTHMCYSEFNDIIESIAAMDADVIAIETSRSRMELLRAFATFHYPNEIGPGVYDIHSPRVPGADEMQALLHKALEVLDPAQIWVNPDCGLKTRRWEEVKPALTNMVAAARKLRAGAVVAS